MKWVIIKSSLCFVILAAIALLPIYRCRENRRQSNFDLLDASERGNVRDIEQALTDGADANETDAFEMTPLMIAAGAGRAKAVELLLNHGASIDASADLSGTALMRAASDGNTDVVRILLKRGASVNNLNRFGESALVRAIECGDAPVEIVQMLLRAGADPNVRCLDGQTPLSLAMSNGDFAKAKCLIAGGARIQAVKPQPAVCDAMH